MRELIVAIPVHNAPDDLDACVRSLMPTLDASDGVMIFDDASNRHTREVIATLCETFPGRIEVLSVNDNVGYTRAVHLLMISAQARFVALINSDVTVRPGWREPLLEPLRAGTHVAVGPVSNAASYQSVPERFAHEGKWSRNEEYDAAATTEDERRWVDFVLRDEIVDVPVLNGFFTAFVREAVLRAGSFDYHAFPNGYGEENDLCIRLVRGGGRLGVVARVYVSHEKSRSFGTARRREHSREGNSVIAGRYGPANLKRLTDDMLNDPNLALVRETYRTARAAARGALSMTYDVREVPGGFAFVSGQESDAEPVVLDEAIIIHLGTEETGPATPRWITVPGAPWTILASRERWSVEEVMIMIDSLGTGWTVCLTGVDLERPIRRLPLTRVGICCLEHV